jgi:flavin prenyltransferase
MKIIVGVSGASGVIMSCYLLKALKEQQDMETHLVVSESARKNWQLETNIPIEKLYEIADYNYDDHNMAAAISSGSFKTDGMILIPCSMKTLSGIATGYAANLIVRAADVCLKEGRKVVLVPREMPLGKIHLMNMKTVSDLGCVLIPPMLTFYNKPQSVDDQINHIIGKILMQFGLDHKKFVSWTGV